MKLAIGTSDGVSVCDHLARSSGFLVLDVEDGRVVAKSLRQRGQDGCGNHATFVEMLDGCQAVLCGGIGTGAYDALVAHGIQPVIAAGAHSVDDAVALYLAGKLATTTERVCLCGPHHED